MCVQNRHFDRYARGVSFYVCDTCACRTGTLIGTRVVCYSVCVARVRVRVIMYFASGCPVVCIYKMFSYIYLCDDDLMYTSARYRAQAPCYMYVCVCLCNARMYIYTLCVAHTCFF